MYKEIKVYGAGSMFDRCCYDQVFICRGAACDEAWGTHRGRSIHESRVLYNGEMPADEAILYCWIGEDSSGLRATAWYLTEEEAEESGVRCKLCNGSLQLGILRTNTIDPISQPFSVTFLLDEKGRPYTRLNAHPERDGVLAKGKIFFPDRTLTGMDSGEALVSIAKEFETYGFLSGEMVKYGMPDMDKFLDWAWNERGTIGDVLLINHPGRGEYLVVQKKGGLRRVMDFPMSDSEKVVCASTNYEKEVQADVERYLVWQKPLDRLFLEDAWGMEVDLDALDAQFERSRLFESGRVAVDWVESIKFRGEQVDDAVQRGILSQYVSPSLHIEVMTFNRQNISLLGNYPYSDVMEIAKVVSRVNQEADEAGRAKVRKGLLLPFCA